jgi:glycosyltransferase involved in cell wall biosynthesis
MEIIHTVASIEELASGPAYSVPALANAQGEKKENVRVYSLGVPSLVEKTHYDHQRFASDFSTVPILRKIGASGSMFRELRNARVQIIHNHGVWLMPNIYGASCKKSTTAKFVFAPRGMLSEFSLSFSPWRKKLFGGLFQWRALSAVDMFHATSEQECNEIRAYGYSQPVAIVPNGIDIPKRVVRPKIVSSRQVLYLGRIHPKKRLSDLVEAWSQLESQHADWRLRIIGTNELGEVEILRKIINEKQLKNISIEAALYGAEKNTAYGAADLFVLPTGNENFAMTVAEALSHGVPVVCTKGAPWSGLVKHGCGWWTEIGSAPIAAALHDAMSQSEKTLKEMGLRGRAWMERDFAWEQVAENMLEAYGWLLNGGDKPACVRVS